MTSGSADGSVLIWDVTGARSHPKPAVALVAADLDKLWNDLAAADAVVAYEAMCRLRASPAQAMEVLARRLKPVPNVDAKRLTQVIAKLDSSDFKVRSQASKELEEMGEAAAPALREARANNANLELSRRVEQLLARLQGEVVRTGRALEVLEQIGDDARRLLSSLARGAPAAQLTQDSRAALDRLDPLSARPGH